MYCTIIKTYDIFQSLYQAVERVKTSLETEQEKLATLVKNLSADPAQRGVEEQKGEEPVSEEWLQSLKERRKVIKLYFSMCEVCLSLRKGRVISLA